MTSVLDELRPADGGEALGTIEAVMPDLGALATAEIAEAAEPPVEYSYSVTYGAAGRIATSTSVYPQKGETTFVRYGEEGEQLSKFVTDKEAKTERMYDGKDRLVSDRTVSDDGNLITSNRYSTSGKRISGVVINLKENTHAMTLYDNGDFEPYTVVSKYRGVDGWVS